MRVGLVSPYSYTYPGGVGRHVEALAEELIRQGHDVRLMAPCDPDDRHARATHRGVRPQRRPLPDYLIPLGRTIGVPTNGAVSNVAFTPTPVSLLSKELRHGGYDLIHVHEPNVPAPELVRDRGGTHAARRHVPHLLDLRAHEPDRRQFRRRPPPLLEASCPHRRLRGRALDGAALLRRRLPRDPQRRRPALRPARTRPRRWRAAAPVRRSRRGAQGPARAAARVRGAARRRRAGTADGGRGDHGRGRAAAARSRGRRGGRPGHRRGEVAPARRGRPAGRPLARRRELRHGADRGVCLGHPRGLLGHRGLPRRRTSRQRRLAGARGAPGGARRDAALAGARPEAARPDVRGGARERPALRMAPRGERGRGDL